jgi:menaquinone-specific isochorismate synthase
MWHLKYQKKVMKIRHALSFWKHFEQEERILFYNPLSGELVIGAKRLNTFAPEESYQGYPYIFSSRTFFESVKDQKWEELGNETIAFQYYFTEINGQQIRYFAGEDREIDDVDIYRCEHSFRFAKGDYPEWEELFQHVHQEITAGCVKKVVISREVQIDCHQPVNIESVLRNLLENNQTSFVFAYAKKGKVFLGATPEILVQKDKNTIISYALAGTMPRDEKEDEKQKQNLMDDRKNREEHQIVLDTILAKMKKYGSEAAAGETTILSLKNLHHLQTRLTAKDNASLLEWVTRLHPTPALGGDPVQLALDLIAKYEKHERGLYAAPLSLLNGTGEGIAVAGIRSALIEGSTVYAYTGCGIVKQSVCEEEYLETMNKLRTILESL